jgi:hypothetical protein
MKESKELTLAPNVGIMGEEKGNELNCLNINRRSDETL